MRVSKKTLLDAMYRKVFIQGEDPNIFDVIYSYRILSGISEELQEALYNYLADRAGISRETQLTNEQQLLIDEFIRS